MTAIDEQKAWENSKPGLWIPICRIAQFMGASEHTVWEHISALQVRNRVNHTRREVFVVPPGTPTRDLAQALEMAYHHVTGLRQAEEAANQMGRLCSQLTGQLSRIRGRTTACLLALLVIAGGAIVATNKLQTEAAVDLLEEKNTQILDTNRDLNRQLAEMDKKLNVATMELTRQTHQVTDLRARIEELRRAQPPTVSDDPAKGYDPTDWGSGTP